jgi:RNA polymerase sigma factor (sigma-70 family)
MGKQGRSEARPGGRLTGEEVDQAFRENLPWLRGWLGARLRGRRRQDADDLAQEILLSAFRGLSSLRRSQSFSSWLYRIATNRLRDYLRRERRSREEAVGVEFEPVDPRRPDETLETREDAERLLGALLDLPPKYREPLILRHVEELSYDRIAGILGITKNNVQVRIFRGRQLLRNADGSAESPAEAAAPRAGPDRGTVRLSVL